MRHRNVIGLLVCLLILAAPAWAAVVNGDFESVINGKPEGWQLMAGGSVEFDEGKHFVRLQLKNAGTLHVSQTVDLDPAWTHVRLSVRARCSELVPGPKNWHTARLNMNFVGGAGMVGEYQGVALSSDQKDWRKVELIAQVPQGALRVRVMPGLFSAAGTLDLDDCAIEGLINPPKDQPKAAP